MLTNECIKRCSPDSTEQLEAWRTDFMRYYKERFSILQLAEKHMDLLRDALTQWEEIERSHIINIFESIGRSNVEEANIGSEFDLWFSEVSLRRNDAENNATGAMRTAGQLLRGNFALGNLSWVEDLAVFLPQAVDKSLKVKVATHGRRVAALFFLEMFAKARGGHDPGIDNNVFNKCEAAWQLASYHGGLTP